MALGPATSLDVAQGQIHVDGQERQRTVDLIGAVSSWVTLALRCGIGAYGPAAREGDSGIPRW